MTNNPPEPPSHEPAPREHHRRLHLTLPGCWGALVLACLSFTPSLLPRGGVLQGLVCGIGAAIGYGLGVVAAYVWRAFADRDARSAPRRSWLVLFVSAIVLFGVSFGLGQYWQHEIRGLMGVTDYNVLAAVACPLVAAVVFLLLLLAGRGLRALYRRAAALLGRWIGRRAARVVGWLLVAGLAWAVFSGVLLSGFVNAANESFSLGDTQTPEGCTSPRPCCGRAVPARWCRGTRWVTRGGLSRAADRRPRRSARSPTARRRSPSGPTPGWKPPTTRSPGRPGPSRTSNGRAVSNARTCS